MLQFWGGSSGGAQQRIVNAVESMEIMKKMKEFDESHENNPMFMVFRQYIGMLEMLMFISAVRTGNWELHLEALEIFTMSISLPMTVWIMREWFLSTYPR